MKGMFKPYAAPSELLDRMWKEKQHERHRNKID